MAESNKQGSEWNEGVTNFFEAARHSATATRLATAGVVALGAAASAYLWDSNRRNTLIDSMSKLPGNLMSMWGVRPQGQGAAAPQSQAKSESAPSRPKTAPQQDAVA